MEILFEHVRDFTISIELFKLIQAFFEYFNSIPESGLNDFWTKNLPQTEDPQFNKTLIKLFNDILDEVAVNVDNTSDEAMQNNMIRIKLCLMIYLHRTYQSIMHYIANGVQREQDTQIKLTKIILQLYEKRSIWLELNDVHFIEYVVKFMNFRKNEKENGRDILRIITYVYSVKLLFFFSTK